MGEITINLDSAMEVTFYDYEGDPYNEVVGIEEAIVLAAAQRLYAELKDDIRVAIREQVERRVTQAIDAALMPVAEDILNEPYKVLDGWGRQEKATTLRELMVEHAQKFVSEQVDRNGNSDRYSRDKQPRWVWVVEKAIKEGIDKRTRSEIRQAVDAAKQDAIDAVAKILASEIARSKDNES